MVALGVVLSLMQMVEPARAMGLLEHVLFVPAAAHVNGTGGTTWRSDVVLHNPGGGEASVELVYLKSGEDNSSPAAHPMTVPPGSSVRLADVMRFTGQVSLASGTLDEAELLQPPPVQRAAIERTRGRIDVSQHRVDDACVHLQRAIGLGLRNGDRRFLCETYIDLAAALSQRGEPASAAAELAEGIDVITLGEGLEVDATIDELWFLGFRLAALYLQAGELIAAERVATTSLRHAEHCSAAQGRGRLYALLAEIAEKQGRTREALTHRARAIDELRHLGDRRSTAELLIENARTTRELGPHKSGSETAASARQIACELANEIGWRDGARLAASQ